EEFQLGWTELGAANPQRLQIRVRFGLAVWGGLYILCKDNRYHTFKRWDGVAVCLAYPADFCRVVGQGCESSICRRVHAFLAKYPHSQAGEDLLEQPMG